MATTAYGNLDMDIHPGVREAMFDRLQNRPRLRTIRPEQYLLYRIDHGFLVGILGVSLVMMIKKLLSLLVVVVLLSACTIPRLSDTDVLTGKGVQFDPDRFVFTFVYLDPGLMHAPAGTTPENHYIEGIGNPRTRIQLLFSSHKLDLPSMMKPLIVERVLDSVPITDDPTRPFLYIRVAYGFQKFSPFPADVRPLVMIEPIIQRGPGGEHLWRSMALSGKYDYAVGPQKLADWLEEDSDVLLRAFQPAIAAAVENLERVF